MLSFERPLKVSAPSDPRQDAYESDEAYLKDQLERLDLLIRLRLESLEPVPIL